MGQSRRQFPLLLLIGGDIIQKALAQISMTRFRPIYFSFGWVAYAFTALLFAIENLKTLPDPDCPCTLIDVGTGYTNVDQFWLLGKLLRHHKSRRKEVIERRSIEVLIDEGDQLKVFVHYNVTAPEKWRITFAKDWPWISGISTTLLQLALQLVCTTIERYWPSLLLKPFWSMQLHILRGNESGIDLQYLSSVDLLISVSSLHTNTWYMVGVGALGMLQNLMLAVAPRTPSVLGMKLELDRVIARPKVMDILFALEKEVRNSGIALLPIYFPGTLRKAEQKRWEDLRVERKQLKI